MAKEVSLSVGQQGVHVGEDRCLAWCLQAHDLPRFAPYAFAPVHDRPTGAASAPCKTSIGTAALTDQLHQAPSASPRRTGAILYKHKMRMEPACKCASWVVFTGVQSPILLGMVPVRRLFGRRSDQILLEASHSTPSHPAWAANHVMDVVRSL
jgi:hypothetical protein